MVITTSERMPNMTMTVSATVPAEIASAVKEALINASITEEGKAMLEQINADEFVVKSMQGWMNFLRECGLIDSYRQWLAQRRNLLLYCVGK